MNQSKCCEKCRGTKVIGQFKLQDVCDNPSCPCHQPKQWEGFKKDWEAIVAKYGTKLDSFPAALSLVLHKDLIPNLVSSLLSSQRAEIIKEVLEVIEKCASYGSQSVPNDEFSVGYYDGYQKALAQVKAKLDSLKEK